MLRLALGQINVTVGDLSGNREKIAQHLVLARQMGVDLIAFPELAVTGYPPEDLLLKPHFIRDNLKVLKTVLPCVKNLTAVIGFVDRDRSGRIFNAAAVVCNGKLKGVYHKRELPNYGVFDEKRYFSVGEKFPLLKINGIAVGLSICEDIWVADGPAFEQARAGAQVLLNISSSPYHAGKGKLREALLKKRAREHHTFVGYANLVGGQDELVFDGGSLIIGPDGKILSRSRQFQEDLVVADILLSPQQKSKSRGKILGLSLSKEPEARIPIRGHTALVLPAVAEMYQALVLGTRDYVLKNNFQKAVIGLSGGIDSALTASIACEALGAHNVVGLSFPSRYNSEGTRSDAKLVAENLGIQFQEISIEPLFKAYLEVLKASFAGQPSGLAEENLQARIRGNLLMAFSNAFGWLVLTTGNKSEVAVGYCTLYGDMAGGFGVIKDVPKTKVYDLAAFVNEKNDRDIIPLSVIQRAPTAELRENQKDQDSLPEYALLDEILWRYVEEHQSMGEMQRAGLSPEVLSRVTRMVDFSEYKRRQAAPGIKITPRAFGKDWRLPVTNRYRESSH